MRINIIAIGKFRNNCPNAELFADYVKKTKWKINLTEIPHKISGSVDEIKEKEADLLMKNIATNSFVILLDEKGVNLSSKEFAKKFEDLQNQSLSQVDFIIGGANGVSEKIKKLANFQIAFGKMTFPHMMIRAMIAEQIYRAFLINNNHPYHKE